MSDSDVALANNKKDKLSKDEIVPESLKYHLLGPSLTKAGQETVDQSKVRIEQPSVVLPWPMVACNLLISAGLGCYLSCV